MIINEDQWTSININKNQWRSMNIKNHQWRSMNINEDQWTSMKINEHQWRTMNINNHQWRSMKINEYQYQWISMNINDTYYIRIYVYYIYPTLSFVPQNDSCSRRPTLTCNWRICVVTLWPQSTTVNPLRPWFPWVRQEIPWLGES